MPAGAAAYVHSLVTLTAFSKHSLTSKPAACHACATSSNMSAGGRPTAWNKLGVCGTAPEHVELPKCEHAFKTSIDVMANGQCLHFVDGQAVRRLDGELLHGRLTFGRADDFSARLDV